MLETMLETILTEWYHYNRKLMLETASMR
jgi:hypothetical protein